MRMNSGQGDIVHAGTYFGDFLPALSMSCRSDAKVWAFEPNSENYRCALMTISINNLQNVEIRNAGLGSGKTVLPMMTHDEIGRSLGGASRIYERPGDQKKGRFAEAEILALDDALPSDRRIAIIQLDVEGYEEPALAGAMETIKRCKPILILENLPDGDWLTENIFSLGYRKTGRVHANTILTADN